MEYGRKKEYRLDGVGALLAQSHTDRRLLDHRYGRNIDLERELDLASFSEINNFQREFILPLKSRGVSKIFVRAMCYGMPETRTFLVGPIESHLQFGCYLL